MNRSGKKNMVGWICALIAVVFVIGFIIGWDAHDDCTKLKNKTKP